MGSLNPGGDLPPQQNPIDRIIEDLDSLEEERTIDDDVKLISYHAKLNAILGLLHDDPLASLGIEVCGIFVYMRPEDIERVRFALCQVLDEVTNQIEMSKNARV